MVVRTRFTALVYLVRNLLLQNAIPIIDRVDRTSVSEKVDSGLIPGRVKQDKKSLFAASMLDVLHEGTM